MSYDYNMVHIIVLLVAIVALLSFLLCPFPLLQFPLSVKSN